MTTQAVATKEAAVTTAAKAAAAAEAAAATEAEVATTETKAAGATRYVVKSTQNFQELGEALQALLPVSGRRAAS